VNVWVALAHRIHPHHSAAKAWEESLPVSDILVFCRFTQLGLLRLLTNPSAMGEDVLTQVRAWAVYDALFKTGVVEFAEEPSGIDPVFRRQTARHQVSTKQWADGYLEAFSIAAEIPLITFDRALAGKAPNSILLS
jgi:toxin-antitoxin system PIN domain toxin